MARKTSGTLEEQRAKIKKEYRRGGRSKKIVSEDSLTAVELAVKKEAACFLKAGGFSHSYIGDALGFSKGVIKDWFEHDAKMHERVAKIQLDHIDGAITLLRTYAVELVEMLVEIARTTSDEKIALQAITEGLDRMGLSKVNKSESAAVNTNKTEVDITDGTGLLASLKDAPPAIQQKAAEQMQDLMDTMALAAEHVGVTDA